MSRELFKYPKKVMKNDLMSEARTLISHVKGERIDKFLAWTQKDLSRSQIYIMMNNGFVLIKRLSTSDIHQKTKILI